VITEFICKVIAVEEESFVMECILDKKKKISQKRRFEKSLANSNIDLKIGNFVLIEVEDEGARRTFSYKNYTLKDTEKNLFTFTQEVYFR
jgi:hypothetical protein